MTSEARHAVLLEDNLMATVPLIAALQACGYQVHTEAVAPDLAERIVRLRPQLVVVSLAARRFDPLAVIQAVRRDPAGSALPILAYAGHVERELLQAGLNAGADMVAPNSALRGSLPEVLAGLTRRVRESTPPGPAPRDS